MIIYLDGYHNEIRRELLQLVHHQLLYLHFGDIDAGGFEIYGDLCQKTGIAFEPYYIDLQVLKSCLGYAKLITANGRKRLERLQVKYPDRGYGEVLDFILENGVKLEQECIVFFSMKELLERIEARDLLSVVLMVYTWGMKNCYLFFESG